MFRHLRRGAGFYQNLCKLAFPLILQNLITTSLGFVDTFMVGLLGSNELSAVTAANTPVFLVQIIILGLISGLTVLVSQYWGKGDVEAINRCMGAALYAGLSISGACSAGAAAVPKRRHGSGHRQRPAGGAGGAVPAHRGRQLRVQRRQLRVRRDAAQHGKARHGHGHLRRVHAAEHPFELHPDFRKAGRARPGHHRGGQWLH